MLFVKQFQFALPSPIIHDAQTTTNKYDVQIRTKLSNKLQRVKQLFSVLKYFLLSVDLVSPVTYSYTLPFLLTFYDVIFNFSYWFPKVVTLLSINHLLFWLFRNQNWLFVTLCTQGVFEAWTKKFHRDKSPGLFVPLSLCFISMIYWILLHK